MLLDDWGDTPSILPWICTHVWGAEGTCMNRSGIALLIKLRHYFIKHNGEEQNSENNAT